MLILLASAIIATVPATDCAAYEPVRRQFAEAQQAIRNGASDADLAAIDVVGPMRSCFRTQVMPGLVRAERDERMIEDAASAFFAWGRQAALLGASDALAAEFTQGLESVTKGVSHAYAVARDRCIRLNDEEQLLRMLELMRFAQLLGFEITQARGEDMEGCLRGRAYLVEVTLKSESSRRGLGSSYTYNALLRRAADGDPGDLAGGGSYSGFLIARNANCHNDAPDAPQRLEVQGRLEATGSLVDMAPPGARPDPHLVYVLGTTDWDLRPLWGGDGPFAETAEEREGLKGLGTTMSARPIRLTGRVTTVDHRSESDADNCNGVTTRSTHVRIVQLAGKKR